MKKLRPGEMVQIKTVEELLGVVNEESAMDIEIYKIHSFQGHPFKVVDDDKMLELVESIKANAVLSPVLIRPCGNDLYEMISGHRRLHAAKLAGLTAIPSIIREMTDDELVNYCNVNNIEIDEDEKTNPVLLHAKVGANIAKVEFGFPENMANAIKYHTVGNVPMDRISEILFISDSISEDRKYDGVDKLRELAKKDIDKTILEIIDSTIELIKSRNRTISENTLKLRKYYSDKINNK